MIYRGLIVGVPNNDSNEYTVRIPILEGNNDTEFLLPGYASNFPGLYQGYAIDDPVFVAFDSKLMDEVVILGKMYVEMTNESNSYGVFDNLVVNNGAELPADTKIGPYSAKDIFNLYQKTDMAISSGIDVSIIRW